MVPIPLFAGDVLRHPVEAVEEHRGTPCGGDGMMIWDDD